MTIADRPRLAAALLAAAYLLAALHGLGAADIVGDDEAREAGIVQEIVAGHWLWPEFNGDTLPDKPTLFHWLAAVGAAPAGFSEFAVRLPSAVAGAALVGWTARFGADLLGPAAGLVAAALLATMPGLFDHVRVARPDVLLVLLLSAALGHAFRRCRGGPRREATLALVLLGAATLAKGPVAPVLFTLTVGGFLLWQRDPGRLRDLVTAPGLCVFVLLAGGWYALALGGWGSRFVHDHLVGRYLRNLAGGLVTGGPWSSHPLWWHLVFYVEHLPVVVLPWTPFVALALWRLGRTGGLANPRVRFLLCWALAPVIAFTPAEWKLRYYLLPSLPPLALLAAPTVLALLKRPLRPGHLSVARGVAALAGAAVLVAAGALLVARPALLSASDRSNVELVLAALPGGGALAAAIAGIVLGALLGVVAIEAWSALVVLLAAASALWLLVGTPALEQAQSRRDSLRPFAEAVAVRYPAPAPVVFAGAPIRSLVVYLDRHVPLARAADLAPGMGVIAAEADYQTLIAHGRAGPPLAVATGRLGNLARGRVVLADGIGERPR